MQRIKLTEVNTKGKKSSMSIYPELISMIQTPSTYMIKAGAKSVIHTSLGGSMIHIFYVAETEEEIDILTKALKEQ